MPLIKLEESRAVNYLKVNKIESGNVLPEVIKTRMCSLEVRHHVSCRKHL